MTISPNGDIVTLNEVKGLSTYLKKTRFLAALGMTIVFFYLYFYVFWFIIPTLPQPWMMR
jgi:hypothetical protein